MKHEVKYNGYTAQPSDYDSPDGDLALAVNLLREDGSVKPLFQPATLFHITDMDVLYFHVTPTFKHYIAKGNDNKLYWIDESDTSHIPHLLYELTDFPPVCRINAVGNTLCVLCGSAGTPGATDGMHYFLWKSDNNSYFYLGRKPPFVELSFGLSENRYTEIVGQGHTEHYVEDIYSGYPFGALFAYCGNEEGVTNQRVIRFRDEESQFINNAIYALLNKTNAKINKLGHFYAPFWVRYCYRMYDGTMWMHSAPVFMPVCMPHNFMFSVTADGSNVIIPKAYFKYYFHNVALTCKVLNPDELTILRQEWQDIVKSVDIFVSTPIINSTGEEKLEKGYLTNEVIDFTQYSVEYGYVVAATQSGKLVKYEHPGYYCVDFHRLSDDGYLDKIKSVSNFYRVCTYNLQDEELPTSDYGDVNIDKTVLQTLATQEVMTDDYKSHNDIMPTFDDNGNCVTSLFNYNGRQNISAPSERLFEGFKVGTLVPCCTAGTDVTTLFVKAIDIVLKTENGTRVVKFRFRSPTAYMTLDQILYNVPLFYPDNRAIEMRITYSRTLLYAEDMCYLPMKPCPMLNGAFTHGGIMSSMEAPLISTTQNTYTGGDIVSMPYKIYTSEVNNPFIFPPTGINSVGTGTILGLSSATKALSQGQFGQFPLYAFTTEGVWALTVNATGGFSAVHPVTRDVCTNTDSITQLDSSVLFTTDRGIMMLTGSDATCVSDFLASETPFDITNMPDYALLLALPSPPPMPSMLPFSGFLEGCRMIYDYSHQRIILFNPSTSYSYAYVLSLKSKLWGMMENNISYNVNSYPDARAVTHNNDVVSFSEYESTQDAKQFLITRPLKLGDGNVYKTITTLIQRGYFVNGRIKTVLWGSNDLHRWYLIGSSVNHELRNIHGTGYKYFRFAAIGTLGDGEALSGASVEFTPRYTNNLH